ncbi:MAG: penicillin-binding transpeptidase domain-containing protein, partial [Pseudomonadota bacterium]
MTDVRVPLRPLARIIRARARGEDPSAIEAENRETRHQDQRAAARRVAAGRLWVLGLMFIVGYGAIGLRMAELAGSEPSEPRATAHGASQALMRGDITDRHGRILATNIETFSLYAHPQDMIEPIHAAEQLAQIFPELSLDRLRRDFTGSRKFVWIKRSISPEQRQAVHDIGEPGLLFGPRERRLYPNGSVAAHTLGGATYGEESVRAAEVIGRAGVEKFFDAELRDPARATDPLALSIDLSLQAITEEILAGGMKLLNAKGAAAVLMDARTGEILTLVSLPDFDPNDPPPPLSEGDAADSPLFNRALQGVYELGSAFKIFTVAQAMELGLITPETPINTRGPLKMGGFEINDFRDYGSI